MTDEYQNPDHPDHKPQPQRTRARVAGPAAESHAILRSMLTPDERILNHATISPGIYWKGIAVLAIALLMCMKAFNLGLFLLLVTA
ncbi:MAG: hypothetical protein JWO78_1579, partial [Micavibrio sp.]|nr:hypothetical protein [Micavibrio sp.]